MKISLHGSYFGDNFGDVLLVKVFHNWIKEIDPNIQINYPLMFDENYEIQPDNKGIINFLKSDLLLYCGGGYFGENKSSWKWYIRNTYRHLIVGYLALLLGKKTAIFGVEVGPIENKIFKKLVINLFNKSQISYVRNQESYDFLINNGVNKNKIGLVTDTILALRNYKGYEDIDDIKNNKLIFHLAFGILHIKEIESIFRAIVDLMKENDSLKGYELIFLEDYSNQYNSIYNNCFNYLNNNKINYKIEKYRNTDTLINTIKNSEMVVTTKLHVGIVAASYSKKVLSIYSHLKVPRLHKQINNEDNCLNIENITEDTFKNKFLECYNSNKISIPQNIVELSEKNKVEFQKIIKKYK